MHILLVEDDRSVRPAFTAALKMFGYQVTAKENGRDARDFLAAHNIPDVIISDDDMPELTGKELVEWVRQNKRTADIPFVITSGVPKPWMGEGKARLRFAFLEKPFRREQVHAALEEAVQLVAPK